MHNTATQLFLLALTLSLTAPAQAEDFLGDFCRALDIPPEEIKRYPPHLTHMHSVALRESYRREDWEALDEQLAAIPATKSWGNTELTTYPAVWQQAPGSDVEKAKRWVEAAPKSAWAACALAQACTNRAWQARGTGFAPSVSQEGWASWGELIPRAREWVEAALKLDPKLPWALSLRVHLDRCDSSSRGERGAHYAAAKELAPGLFSPHSEVFWMKLPRYGGTWKEAWAHVEAYAKEHPDEEGPLRLLMDAHKVRVSEVVRSRDPEARRRGARDYFSREDVRAQLEEAIARVRAARPDSALPAGIARQLALVRGDQAAVAELEGELLKKGAVGFELRAAAETLERSQDPEEKRAALKTVVKAFSTMNVSARQILGRLFIGSKDPRDARNPRMAYLMLRCEGELGSLSAEATGLELLAAGRGVQADPEGATATQIARAKQGNQWCAFYAGAALLADQSAKKEERAQGVKFLIQAAKEKVELAHRLLIRVYLGHRGEANRDLDQAERWLVAAERRRMRGAAELRAELTRARAQGEQGAGEGERGQGGD